MKKDTQNTTAREASATALNDSDSGQLDYMVIGHIAEPTNAAGVTLITAKGARVDEKSNPFDSVEALSTRFFSEHDVGKKVACMPIAGSDRVMLMGFMPEDETAGISPQSTILDELLSTTQETQETQNSHNQANSSVSPGEEGHKDAPVFDSPDSAIEPSDEANNITVIADGKEAEHLLLRAETAITIQAGESSITLNSDGRVRINGRYINSRASHTQRISGGAVKIN